MNDSFIEMLESSMKLYMDFDNSEIQEVNIPIEYFTEHDVIDKTLRNLILMYNRDYTRMNETTLSKCKLTGFKICKDKKKYLMLEYSTPDGPSKPYRISIAKDYITSPALKIWEATFLRELENVLNKKIIETDRTITNDFENGKITRAEWLQKRKELEINLPSTPLAYMKAKITELQQYFQHITNRSEYQNIFLDNTMTTLIAKDRIYKRRVPGDREKMERVNDVMSFEDRDAFLRKFTSRKVIRISDKDDPNNVIYMGYIINSGKNNGVFIVLEPKNGEKTTYITFNNYHELDMYGEILQENSESKITPNIIYEHIIRVLLSKTRSEKSRDSKVVAKYHVAGPTYMKNLEYLITGNEELDISYSVKNEREELVH